MAKTPIAPVIPAPTPADTTGLTDAQMADGLAAAAARLSPPAGEPVPAPMDPVQLHDNKVTAPGAKPAPGSALFDRTYTIEALLGHPSSDVRQRAQEAQVAIHHGAADRGIKMKAAIDSARAAEKRR